MKFEHTSGGFTLPGESGQEKLTLELAKKWGADVIRDSDGTQLSDEILNAGYDIYSTICIIRDHNTWAKEHPECLQQSFLSTEPVIAAEEPLTVKPMAGFFDEQFKINDRPEALRYWQVWDRTANKLLPADTWQWDAAAGTVTVASPVPFHAYTVSFLAWRTWEEINMYNHVTNSWTSEHLLPVDPRTKEAQAFLYDWLKNWCETHPQTNVVRFTSMFYNFVWIWGSDKRNQNLFTDWGSYDFTVSEKALDDFAAQYGYTLTAEDFINKGSLQVTHMPPTAHKRDYMEFTQQFVAGYGKKLVDLVHSYGKRAYVFYDDSWVGVEPYGPHFKKFGFDGVLKCVFSGYEARMCADVDAPVHELRFHPYLFPVGLGGAPTFAPGGNPTRDAAEYWNHVRRALLRAKIDRIGLGGYLHLLNDFPDFVEYVESVCDEFRVLYENIKGTTPYCIKNVAVLNCWGKMRAWGNHMVHHGLYYKQNYSYFGIIEALSGAPFNVTFISFEDILENPDILKDIDVIINVGDADTAHTGGEYWCNPIISSAIKKFVYEGGGIIGVGEPGAHQANGRFFQLANVFGVEEETGFTLGYDKYNWEVHKHFITEDASEEIDFGEGKANIYALEGSKILALRERDVQLAVNAFGQGRAVYIGGLPYSFENSRLLYRAILWSTHEEENLKKWFSTNYNVEVHAYIKNGKYCVVNNTYEPQKTTVYKGDGTSFELQMEANQIIWYEI